VTLYRLPTRVLTDASLIAQEVAAAVEPYGRNGVADGLLIAPGTEKMTFSEGPDGAIYVTTSRIQDSAFFNPDAPPAWPTQLWRLRRGRAAGGAGDRD
jgi:hypothetical protein